MVSWCDSLSLKRSVGLTRWFGVLCDVRIPVRDAGVVQSDIEYCLTKAIIGSKNLQFFLEDRDYSKTT